MVEKCFDIETIVSRYVAELKRNGISPKKVILFGSYARGDATPLSDIDLVIISDDLAKWPAIKRIEMLSRLTACVDAPLDVLGYTPDEITRGGKDSIIWSEITRHGKTLVAA
jgi:predicted nucleotidyltransferase